MHMAPAASPSPRPGVGPWAVAGTYVGTVIGAGFASGQEILQFFGFFGWRGLAGILLSTFLLAWFGVRILLLGHRLRAPSYRTVLHRVAGPLGGRLIDGLIAFFLFGGAATMAAGAGAVFEEQFGWPAEAGRGLMVAAAALTVLLGLRGVVRAVSLVVPGLLGAVVGLGAWSAATGKLRWEWSQPEAAAVPWWPLSAVVYASYNLVLAIAVLAPLGRAADEASLRRGGWWGGLGLGAGCVAILASLLAHLPETARVEVPMVVVAGALSPLVQTAYGAVLLAEIYTTAVAGLYGVIVRFAGEEEPRFGWLVLGAALLAWTLSRFGFSTLVARLYSLVGYGGILLLAALWRAGDGKGAAGGQRGGGGKGAGPGA